MDIPRPEKLLVAMYQLANGTSLPLEYEDIVVKSWQLFPDEFGLRKYANLYPDSSDQHKPLYGPLKDRGFVLSGNKKFRLTEKGIAYAGELEKVWKGLQPFEQAASANNNPEDQFIYVRLQPKSPVNPARFECVDFIGMTHDEIEQAFKRWGDPNAASRGKGRKFLGGHGNGGKFYMRQHYCPVKFLLTAISA